MLEMNYMQVNIIGTGKFGTALAWLADHNGHEVTLFGRDQTAIDTINQTHTNPDIFPDLVFSKKIKAQNIDDIETCRGDVIVFAIAFSALEKVLPTIKLNLEPTTILVNVAKGIHAEKLLTACDFFAYYFPKQPYVSLSGPNFAHEIVAQKFTTTVLAADEKSWSDNVSQVFRNDWFKPKSHLDVRGIELCGSLKNVMAIASGMYSAIDSSWNPRAAFFTESLREIQNFISALGGQADTTLTNAGVGDLILTTMSNRSRNFTFGHYLGNGLSPDEALERIGSTVEGINATQSAYRLAQKHHIQAPIIDSVYQVLHEGKSVTTAWEDLLKRLPADN